MKKTLTLLLLLLTALALLTGCGAEPELPPIETEDGSGTDTGTVTHTLPASLLDYLAEENGADAIDLSDAAGVSLTVNHCEYGGEEQILTDPETVAQAVEMFAGAEVTGKKDDLCSTGDYVLIWLLDSREQGICGIALQDGALMENDGHYTVTEVQGLLELEGFDPEL